VAVLVAASCGGEAQVYTLGQQPASNPHAQPNQTQSPGQTLGWGSNIENARLARAAELALQHGDNALALDYARRAAQAAPSDPQLWFLLGYAARLNARYQESVDAYRRGLGLNASSVEGLSGLAQTYAGMGRNDDAERLLKQTVAADPRRRDDLLLLGDLSMKSGDYAAALDWLERAERLKPDARSELLLAISYQHLKQLDQANKYLELARRHAPDNPEVQRSMAGYFREEGNYPAAIAALKSIRNPKPDVTAELAYTFQLDGKLEESFRVYTQAANAAPKDIGLQLSAAQAALAAGAVENATPFLARAAALDANHYRLHAIRGEIAKLQERGQDAIQEYTTAIKNLPPSPIEGPLYEIQLHLDLMDVYKDAGDESSAQRELEAAQSKIESLNGQAPDTAQFLRLRATIRMDAGDLDAALADINDALAISRLDRNDLQLDGDILMRLGHIDDAIAAYKKILAGDPDNRFALTSLGYASRQAGRDQDAERFFLRLAAVDPRLYIPHLALGDLYTARREFTKAQGAYSKAFALARRKPLIVAGGMNAAIEAHNLPLAGIWLSRATGAMGQEPQILRQKERYLSFTGDYRASAEVGRQALNVLPRDRDVVVYLGYDLLHLEKYDELLALTSQYLNVLTKEPDLPLLQGYVHKHQGQSELARQDFTEAIARDPEVVTAYVNRGYMLNDLHLPQPAAVDFEAALKREPDNGEAHLGLAYASLDLRKPQAALREADQAERTLGDLREIHVIRATAYGRQDMLVKAAAEYRAALKVTPDDGTLHLELGNTLFAERQYRDAIDELKTALQHSSDNAAAYSLLARAYANLGDRALTLQNVQLAEQHAKTDASGAERSQATQSEIYVSTGEALGTLGDHAAAMDRFRSALTAAGSDRSGVRKDRLRLPRWKARQAMRRPLMAASSSPRQMYSAQCTTTLCPRLTWGAPRPRVRRMQRCALAWPTIIWRSGIPQGRRRSLRRSAPLPMARRVTNTYWPKLMCFASSITTHRRSLPLRRPPTLKARTRPRSRRCSRQEQTKDCGSLPSSAFSRILRSRPSSRIRPSTSSTRNSTPPLRCPALTPRNCRRRAHRLRRSPRTLSTCTSAIFRLQRASSRCETQEVKSQCPAQIRS